MLQIMLGFASCVDVPESDTKDGRAVPSLPSSDRDPVKIKCSNDKPAEAFAAVYDHNHWFWVDDRDWRSKRALSTIMFLFTMIEGIGDERLPMVTIPAQ